MLETGGGGTITFDKLVPAAAATRRCPSSSSSPTGMTGGGSLLNQEIETFDFKKLVGAFDTARSRNPGLSKWALTNGLASFDLGGSNNEALGGELAYTYGTAGSLAASR